MTKLRSTGLKPSKENQREFQHRLDRFLSDQQRLQPSGKGWRNLLLLTQASWKRKEVLDAKRYNDLNTKFESLKKSNFPFEPVRPLTQLAGLKSLQTTQPQLKSKIESQISYFEKLVSQIRPSSCKSSSQQLLTPTTKEHMQPSLKTCSDKTTKSALKHLQSANRLKAYIDHFQTDPHKPFDWTAKPMKKPKKQRKKTTTKRPVSALTRAHMSKPDFVNDQPDFPTKRHSCLVTPHNDVHKSFFDRKRRRSTAQSGRLTATSFQSLLDFDSFFNAPFRK